MDLILCGPTDQPKHVIAMAEVQESRLDCVSTFQIPAYVTSTNILPKACHMPKPKVNSSGGAGGRGYFPPHMAKGLE